ncbi:MAG: hypothetical protein U0R77_14105 [Mycolicibacterium insubricum]
MSATVTGCSSTSPSNSAGTAESITVEQPELPAGVLVSQDPGDVLKSGVYSLLIAARSNPVELAGYTEQHGSDDGNLRVETFTPDQGTWKSMSTRQLRWSAGSQSWVESDRAETLSSGPTGTRGWPTVKGVSEVGTSYYTVGYRELGGQTLSDGLQSGFGQGSALPAAASAARFRPGARSYVVVTTTVEPGYIISRVRQAKTGDMKTRPVNACGGPDTDCTTAAESLQEISERLGVVTNQAGNARIKVGVKGHAYLQIDGAPLFVPLKYQITDTDGPKRMTFAPDTDQAGAEFAKAFGQELANFALFEYQGQVVQGGVQPANTTRVDDELFDRAAVDDVLTQWTPPMPATLG